MEEKSMKENLIECAIIMAVASLCCYGLLWAAEKEADLGIAGMSSERILAQEETRNK